MFSAGTGVKQGVEPSRRRGRLSCRGTGLLGLLSFALCLSSCGCAGFWDDVTSRDFSLNTFFNKPNPLVVLHDSTDGDQRARALKALREPRQYGGTDLGQNAVVKILVAAASTEKQPLCRLAAIQFRIRGSKTKCRCRIILRGRSRARIREVCRIFTASIQCFMESRW